ncbi:unnamed protein product [Polarella glacialis]|uniref:Uncharacterized protein n=1 Tax=Polarella glacialis TaxID=89957 RepID=A0A813K2W3_POLGL|nr:unnamed protein product [Polarella glacialis]
MTRIQVPPASPAPSGLLLPKNGLRLWLLLSLFLGWALHFAWTSSGGHLILQAFFPIEQNSNSNNNNNNSNKSNNSNNNNSNINNSNNNNIALWKRALSKKQEGEPCSELCFGPRVPVPGAESWPAHLLQTRVSDAASRRGSGERAPRAHL